MAAGQRRVVWSDQASHALDEAVAYIAEDSPQAAQRFLEYALDAAGSLAFLSERGRIVPERADPTVREIFVYRYRLMYEVAATEVRILAFLHGARDFARWQAGE
jgi:plasmid stabilization system protein ParE